ncbi:uncharacterized protein K441DRAFT_578977, partial [Cenococcum geophilum 1.58]|uniref:uncharacterized protein n=1 Tax=Cenococcum geophilum 1.58 TaxID=794803 RepID=UPI00358FA964
VKYQHQRTKMDSIEAAIADLRLQDKPNITATAKKHRCNRMTLSKRFRNVTGSRATAHDSMRLLNQIQLKVLIQYINNLTKRGLPPTITIVQNLAARIAGRQLGEH